MTEWTIVVFAGAVGVIFGSFLNVCAWRWPRDESVVSPPSACPACGERVRWHDNIPVVGWLLLLGRCRDCDAPISIQYPLVELTVGLVWAGLTWQHGLSIEALRGSVFLTILLGIALSDARFYIIPDQFSIGGAALGLALSAPAGGPTFPESVVGAALGFVLLWAVAVFGRLAFRKDAMGGGDLKMMAMVGAFVGPMGVLLTIFLGALLGSVIFGPIAWKTKKLVPFGIFLAAGAAVTYGWGDQIIAWYMETIVGL